MTSCILYKVNLDLQRRYIVTNLKHHTDANVWLRDYGEKDYVYEIWKNSTLHSRWAWKKEKWGRLATPKK